MHDTTLFAEMRKKKHLRDKLEARKSTKRDEFDEHSVNPESRKSSSSSEKGTVAVVVFVAVTCVFH